MPSTLHSGRFLISLLMLAFALSAHAEVFRWVDTQGKTHFSDVVPDEYKDVAQPVDATAPSPSPEEQRRAIDRAAREKARAAEAPTIAAPAAASSPAAAASSATASKRPPYAPGDDASCESWRSLYRESLDCFGPYRTARGATKAEAFEHCTPVAEPPLRCGPNTP